MGASQTESQRELESVIAFARSSDLNPCSLWDHLVVVAMYERSALFQNQFPPVVAAVEPPPPPAVPVVLVVPDLNLGVPEEFRVEMFRMGITDGPVLVIEKELTATDVKTDQNRVSMPSKQVTEEFIQFLSEEEKAALKGKTGMEVLLIEPSLNVNPAVNFKLWKLKKKAAKPSYTYVLNGPAWKNVREENQLKAGNKIQIWAFRAGDSLALALVRVPT